MLVPSYDVENVAQLHVGLGRFFDHFWNNSTLQCQRTFIININTKYEWGSICDFFVIHTVHAHKVFDTFTMRTLSKTL